MSGYAVGLDLSLTSTGVAAIHSDGSAFTTLVKSSGSSKDTVSDTARRLGDITSRILVAVEAADPDVVVIESAMFSTHKDSSAHRRAGLWWTVAQVVGSRWPLVEVAPTQLKKYATGKGTAAKEVVLMTAARKWGTDMVPDGNFDRADALFLASMGSQYLGGSVPLKLTDYRRALLESLFSTVLPDASGM